MPQLKTSLKTLARQINFRGLALLEATIPQDFRLAYSPTFIVAPPRAGTTLTRQLITWAIPSSYFSNFTLSAYLTLKKPLPYTTAWISHRLGSDQSGDFQSHYGYTDGRAAPVEGEPLWDYWFQPQTELGRVQPEDLSAGQKRAIYQAVAATERAFKHPFVNKTTVLSLRIEALVDIFPTANFIQVIRNPLDVAQSIFIARQFKDQWHWFGPKPPECVARTAQSHHQEICQQIYYTEKAIARAKASVGAERFLAIRYYDVCHRPRQVLQAIAHFMTQRGAPAPLLRPIPEAFPYSHEQKLADSDYLALRDGLQAHYQQDFMKEDYDGFPETA